MSNRLLIDLSVFSLAQIKCDLKSKGLTYDDVGTALGVSSTHVYMMLNGHRNMSVNQLQAIIGLVDRMYIIKP